ncbi:MAG: hypothetical protein A2X64_05385 [Ignavibacteria bacterium GWF2_33_9]|nr:MAG: hypothetical protein A2X64_05385 [Ignavibacteria bacterium GWF2_33_9]
MFDKNEILEIFQSKKFILYSSISVLTVKLLGDFLLSYFFGTVSFEDNLLWKLVTTALLGVFGFSYLNEILKNRLVKYKNKFLQKYPDDLLKLTIYYFIGIVLSYFISNMEHLLKSSEYPFFNLIQVFGWYYVLGAFWVITFFIKWVDDLKNKRTKSFKIIFLSVFIIIGLNVFVVNVLNYYLDFSIMKDVFDVFIILGFIVVGFSAFILPFDKNWMLIYNTEQKHKIQLWSFLFTITVFTTYILLSNNSGAKNSIDWIFPNVSHLIVYPTFVLTLFTLRVFFVSFSRNKQKYLDFQREKFDFLSKINNLISESINSEKSMIIRDAMEIIIPTFHINYAWVENYNTSFAITFEYNMNEKFIHDIRTDDSFRDKVFELNRIAYFASDNELLEYFTTQKFSGSLIVIPVFERKNRVSTIFLGKMMDFGFKNDEFEMLNTFSTNYRLALENSILVKDSLQKQRYEFELQIAKGIQNIIIPQQIADIPNYSIAGISIPAHELGGDYYDLVYLKGDRPTLLIADVSGKSINAALYLSQLKGIVMSISKYVETPLEFVKELNNLLHLYTEKHIFITLSAITLENNKGLIKYVRAGHSPLLVKNKNEINEYTPQGIALGVTSKALFDRNCCEVEIQLQKGDICFTFTDGFDELRNANNLEFGKEKICNLLLNSEPKKAQDLIDVSMAEIVKFVNGNMFHDDLTLLSLIYTGENE